MHTQADLELQKRETGGPKFLPKFVNDLISAFPEKISAFPQKIFIYLPKFLMTSFFLTSIRGDQNPYFSTYSQCYHYSFCPQGGAKLHCQLRWGPWPDLPPPG